MLTSVSVEAVRQQLEQLGRDVPQELIASFLKDLGVQPVQQKSPVDLEGGEDYSSDEDWSSSPTKVDNQEERLCRKKVEGFLDETEQALSRMKKRTTASPVVSMSIPQSTSRLEHKAVVKENKENSSPADSPLVSYRYRPSSPTSSFRREKSLATASQARSAKTDPVRLYQRTQMSWKSCSSIQNGKKSKPAVNFHKFFAQQHAQSKRQTKRAIQSGRKKAVTEEFVVPTSKRRDDVRWEVRQSLRKTST